MRNRFFEINFSKELVCGSDSNFTITNLFYTASSRLQASPTGCHVEACRSRGIRCAWVKVLLDMTKLWVDRNQIKFLLNVFNSVAIGRVQRRLV